MIAARIFRDGWGNPSSPSLDGSRTPPRHSELAKNPRAKRFAGTRMSVSRRAALPGDASLRLSMTVLRKQSGLIRGQAFCRGFGASELVDALFPAMGLEEVRAHGGAGDSRVPAADGFQQGAMVFFLVVGDIRER